MKLKDRLRNWTAKFAALFAALALSATASADSVAKIGETEYETIQAAVDAVAESGAAGTVTLVSDVTMELSDKVAIASGTTVTLDLGGYTLTGGNTIIENIGKLTLQNGTIELRSDASNAYVINQQWSSSSSSSINNLTIVNEDSSNPKKVYFGSSSKVTIVSGKFDFTGGVHQAPKTASGTTFANINGWYYYSAGGVTLDSTTATLCTPATASSAPEGISTTITLTATPTDENATVTFSSSDTSVATVDESGVVTAVGAGTAKVLATVSDYEFAVCTVTVNAYAASYNGNAYTLADAITAVGTGTGTITLTADTAINSLISLSKAGANLTIDINGNTLTTTSSAFSMTASKNVSLTLTDTAATKGKIVAHGAPLVTKYKGNSVYLKDVAIEADCTTKGTLLNIYGATNTTDNLVLDGVTITATATGNSTGVMYPVYTMGAVDTVITDSTLTRTISNTYMDSSSAIVYATGSTMSNMNGVGSVTISGTTVLEGDVYQVLYVGGGSTASIHGEDVVLKNTRSSASVIYIGSFSSEPTTDLAVGIEGGTFTGQISGGNNSTMAISNGVFNCYFMLTSGTAFDIAGGVFTNSSFYVHSQASLEISGGIFAGDVSDYTIDGYDCVNILDDAGNSVWTVGKVTTNELTAEDGATDTKATYTVDTVVTDNLGNESTVTTEQKIDVVVASDTSANIATGVKLSDVNIDTVIKKAVLAAGTDASSVTTVEIAVATNSVDTSTSGAITFEVEPEATVVITKTVDETTTTTSNTVSLANSDIATDATFTFSLDVSALGVEAAAQVRVVHESDDYDDETIYCTVSSAKTITITTSHFSSWTVSEIPEGTTIVAQVGDTYFDDLDEAIAYAELLGVTTITLSNNPTNTNSDWKISDGYLVKKVYVAEVVSGETTTKYETVAEAIEGASSGDTVNIYSGTHDIGSSTISIDKALTIKGAGKDSTVLCSTASGKAAFSIAASNVTLQDMTINQSDTSTDTTLHISIPYTGTYSSPTVAYSDITLQNLKFTGSKYSLSVYAEDLTIDSCDFDNPAKSAILLYCVKGTTKITDNTFTQTNPGGDGFIYGTTASGNDYSSGTLTISGNTATGGRVLYHCNNQNYFDTTTKMTIEIVGNVATNYNNKAVVFAGHSGVSLASVCNSITITNNVLFTSTAARPTIQRDDTDTSGLAIDATYNYWGTSTPDFDNYLAKADGTVSDKKLVMGDNITYKPYYMTFDEETGELSDPYPYSTVEVDEETGAVTAEFAGLFETNATAAVTIAPAAEDEEAANALSVTFTADAVQAIAEEAGDSSLKLVVQNTTEETEETIDTMTVSVSLVKVETNGDTTTETPVYTVDSATAGSARITVAVPGNFSIASGYVPVIYYVSGNTRERVDAANAEYDSTAKTVAFTVFHFSDYEIVSDLAPMTFSEFVAALATAGGTLDGTARAYRTYGHDDDGRLIVTVESSDSPYTLDSNLSGVSTLTLSNVRFVYTEDSGTATLAVANANNLALSNCALNSVTAPTAVARITTTAGDTADYLTLAKAIAAADDGDTISLLTDIEDMSSMTIASSQSFTLDLNGYSISGSDSTRLLVNNGSLTITDTASGGSISNTSNGIVTNNGTLIIEGGSFSASSGYIVGNAGTATVNGGTFTGTGLNGFINSWGGATLTVNDATVDMTCAYYIFCSQEGTTVTINGGTFKKTSTNNWERMMCIFAAAPGETSSLIINGGTFTYVNEYHADSADLAMFVFQYDSDSGAGTAKLEINDGTFTGAASGMKVAHDHYCTSNGGTVDAVIYGGTFNAQLPISDDAASIVTGATIEAAETDGYWTVNYDFYGTLTQVSSGFYQNASTYSASTDFYITNLNGLKYFRDLVNQNGDVATTYVTTYVSSSTTAASWYTGNIFNGKTVHLMTDVDLESEEWDPIGQPKNTNGDKRTFYGNFNGEGHTISNLKSTQYTEATKTWYAGLFGTIMGSQTISDLTINNVTLIGYDYAGAFVGNAGSNAMTFENCHLTGTIDISCVYAYSYVGGLFGIGTASIDNCSVEGSTGSTIEGTYVGGVAGTSTRTSKDAAKTITDTTVSGVTITTEDGCAGGLVGWAVYSVTAESNTVSDVTVASTNVTESGYVGTLVGYTSLKSGDSYSIIADNEVEDTTATEDGTVVDVKVGEAATDNAVVGSNVTTNDSGLVTGGIFESIPTAAIATGYISVENPDEETSTEYPLTVGGPYVAVIGNTGYSTLAEALTAAEDGDTAVLISGSDEAVSSVGSVTGDKTVYVTGTAKFDWSQGWLMVGRGSSSGNGTLVFTNATITSSSSSANSNYGFNISGSTSSDTVNDGAVIISNSTIQCDNIINKGSLTIYGKGSVGDTPDLIVYNGYGVGGRVASESSYGTTQTATVTLTDGAYVQVAYHNGMGNGYEGSALLTLTDGSKFEYTGNGSDSFANGDNCTDGEGGTGAIAIDATSTFVGTSFQNLDNGKSSITIDATDAVSGTKVIDLSGTNSLEGYVTVQNAVEPLGVIYGSDGDVTLKNAQAKIVAADGTTTYVAAFEDALASAATGSTISLVEDVTMSARYVFSTDRDITLDLAGCAITATVDDLLKVTAGSLTVIDSVGDGSITTTGSDAYTIFCVAGGEVTVNAGTFTTYYHNTVYVSSGSIVFNGGMVDMGTTSLDSYCGDGIEAYAGFGDNDGYTIFAEPFILSVTPSTYETTTLGETSTAQLTATTADGADVTITWSSSDTTIATVDSTGLVTMLGVSGSATIYAAAQNGSYETALVAAGTATVKNTTTGTEYVLLQSAIDAANSGDTLQLIANATLPAAVKIPETATNILDLAGYALTGPGIVNYGGLTVLDSSDEGTGSIVATSGTDAAIMSYGTVSIEGGLIDGSASSVNAAIRVYSGTAVIDGGTFRSDTTSGSHYAIQNRGGTLTINDATVDSGFGAVGNWNGSVTVINGGTFLPTGRAGSTCHVVYVDGSSDVTVYGGTFKMNYASGSSPDSGSALTSYYNGTVNIYGGTFTSHFSSTAAVDLSTGSTIYGGRYSNKTGLSSYVVSGASITDSADEEGFYTVGIPVATVTLADSTSTTYMDLHAALEAGKEIGAVVTLLADVDLSGVEWEPVGTSSDPFCGSFDGNGKTVSGLTIEDDSLEYAGLFGSGSRQSGYPFIVYDLTISNVTITAESYVGSLFGYIYNNPGDMAISNVTVKGQIQITGNYRTGGMIGQGWFNACDCHVIGDEGSYVQCVYKEGDLEGDSVGGFAGSVGEGEYTRSSGDCSVSGLTVTGTRRVGGFAGMVYADSSFLGVTVTNVSIGTTATAEYATSNKKSMGLGGMYGAIYSYESNGGVLSGYVEDVTILSFPSGVSYSDGNVNYGLVTGGKPDSSTSSLINPGTLLDYSGLTAMGYDESLYSNDYLVRGVAMIGDALYDTIDEALAVAESNDVISVVRAGTYTLGDITTYVTISGAVDNVVFDYSGVSNGTSFGATPYGVTFCNIEFTMGGFGSDSTGWPYRGWNKGQSASTTPIAFNDCSFSGLFSTFSQTPMVFTDCTFTQTNNYYFMWIYDTTDVTFDGCTFNYIKKCLHAYNEGNAGYAVEWRIYLNDCYFYPADGTDSDNKGALNVKNTEGTVAPGSVILILDDCTTTDTVKGLIQLKSDDAENTYEAIGSGIGFDDDGLITNGIFTVIDDELIAPAYASVENTDESTKVAYPYTIGGPYAAKIDSTYYSTFADAIAAAETAYETDGVYPTITVLDEDAELTNSDWKISDGYLVHKVYVAQIVKDDGATTNKYVSIAEAVADAEEDDTITVLKDCAVADQMTINKSMTLDLNGCTITNNSTGTRPFYVETESVSYYQGDDGNYYLTGITELTINGNGGGMVIPSTGSAYGFIELAGLYTGLIINGGTFTGNTDNGSFFRYGVGSSPNNQRIELNNVTGTTNSRFVTYQTAYYLYSIKVSGGTYTHTNEADYNGAYLKNAFDFYTQSGIFEGVTITSDEGSCVLCGGSYQTDMVFSNNTFTVNGTSTLSDPWNNAAIAVQSEGTITIASGTYTSDGIYGIATASSGATINLEGGTITGANYGIRIYGDHYTADTVLNMSGDATISGNTAGLYVLKGSGTGTVAANISGGVIDGGIIIKNGSSTATDATVTITDASVKGTLSDISATGYSGTYVVSGGIFSESVAAGYCAAGYAPASNTDTATNGDYPYTVTGDNQARRVYDNDGTTDYQYGTLSNMLANATSGDTVQLLQNVTNSTSSKATAVIYAIPGGVTLESYPGHTYTVSGASFFTVAGAGAEISNINFSGISKVKKSGNDYVITAEGLTNELSIVDCTFTEIGISGDVYAVPVNETAVVNIVGNTFTGSSEVTMVAIAATNGVTAYAAVITNNAFTAGSKTAHAFAVVNLADADDLTLADNTFVNEQTATAATFYRGVSVNGVNVSEIAYSEDDIATFYYYGTKNDYPFITGGDDLADVVSNVKSGTTIYMGADGEFSSAISIGTSTSTKSVTIDGNSNTLTATGDWALTGSYDELNKTTSTFTLQDMTFAFDACDESDTAYVNIGEDVEIDATDASDFTLAVATIDSGTELTVDSSNVEVGQTLLTTTGTMPDITVYGLAATTYITNTGSALVVATYAATDGTNYYKTLAAAVAAADEAEETTAGSGWINYTVLTDDGDVLGDMPSGWMYTDSNGYMKRIVATITTTTEDEESGETTTTTVSYASIAEALEAYETAGYSSSISLAITYDPAWPTATPIWYDGGQYATLNAALTAAYKAGSDEGTDDDIVIHCRPGADVGTMTHGHVEDNLTIYGHGAYVSAGEHDLELDTYGYSRTTGAQASGATVGLKQDVTVSVYALNGIAAWGQRTTDYTITLYFKDCLNMQRVYFSGANGTTDITLDGCSFDADGYANAGTSVYSNAKGDIVIIDTTFNKIAVPININNKSGDAQTVTVTSCTFTDCATETVAGAWSAAGYAAPIRVNAASGTIALSVDGCEFNYTGTEGSVNGDVLVGELRETKGGAGTISYSVEDTAASITVVGTRAANEPVTVLVDENITATETFSGNNAYTVATIGDVKYTSLQGAIDAATEGDTIVVMGVMIAEGSVVFPAAFTNVTIKAADGTTPLLKDTVLSSASGSTIYYEGITIDGLVFDNSRILFTGARTGDVVYKDWTIQNCVFTNITAASNYAAVQFGTFSTDEAMENFTFVSNVIDGVTGSYNSGLNVNASTGTILIEHNLITNVAWNAIQLLKTDDDATVSIIDNDLSSAGDGVVNLTGTGDFTITDNAIVNAGTGSNFEYVPTLIDVTGNYYGGGTPTLYADGTITYASYYTVYTTTEEGWFELSVPSTAIARVDLADGGTYWFYDYDSAFAKAAAGATITLLADGTVTEPVTLPANSTLDGAGMAITPADGFTAGTATALFTVSDGVTLSNVVATTDMDYVYAVNGSCTVVGVMTNSLGSATLSAIVLNDEDATLDLSDCTEFVVAADSRTSTQPLILAYQGSVTGAAALGLVAVYGTNAQTGYEPDDSAKLGSTMTEGSVYNFKAGSAYYATFALAGSVVTNTETSVEMFADIASGDSCTLAKDSVLYVTKNSHEPTVVTDGGEYVILTTTQSDVTTYYTAVAVAQVDGAYYPTFAEAVAAATAGETELTITVVGYTASMVGTQPAGWAFLPGDNDTYTLVRAVAMIVEDTVTTNYYATLPLAFAGAESGETITMLQGVTLTDEIDVESVITLDLNGMTVASSADDAFYVTGEFTVEDSSEATDGSIVHTGTYDAIYVDSEGVFELLSGTIESSAATYSDSSCAIYNKGEVELSGGAVVYSGSNSALILYTDSTTQITNSAVTASSASKGVVVKGTLTVGADAVVSGGTVVVSVENAGELNITGGVVTGTGDAAVCVDGSSAVLCVTGGAVTNSVNGAVVLENCSAATFSAGTVSAENGTAIDDESSATTGISGATIVGDVGVEHSGSGALTISAGTVTGTTTAVSVTAGSLNITDYTVDETTYYPTLTAGGDAVVIGSGVAATDVEISAGVIKGGESGVAVNSSATGDTGFITGGFYSSEVLLENCATGYMPILAADVPVTSPDADATWTVTASAVAQVLTYNEDSTVTTNYCVSLANAVALAPTDPDTTDDDPTITLIVDASGLTAPAKWVLVEDDGVTYLVRAVATTTVDGDAAYYADVQEAIDDAEDGGTVTILVSTDVSEGLYIEKSLTLTGAVDDDDAPRFTLTGNPEDGYNYDVYIEDNSAIDVVISNLVFSAFGSDVASDGRSSVITFDVGDAESTLTLDNVVITDYNTDAIYAADGEVTIRNTTIDGGDNAPAVGLDVAYAGVTMTGTTITNVLTGIYASDCTVGLQNVEIYADGTGCAAIEADDATVYITSGVYGGGLTGDTIVASGGYFDYNIYEDGYCADGYITSLAPDFADGWYLVTDGTFVAYVERDGTRYAFATLEGAIAYAASTETVTLIADFDFTAPLEISKDVTINLNGHSITATDSRALWIKSGTVEITGSGTISANGDNLSASSSVIRVGDSAANEAAASLTIGANVTVTSATCYGITVFGKNNTDDDLTTADISLVVNGTVSVTGEAAAIAGNGSSTLSATTITLNGTVSATQDYAIYHPGKGTLTINGTVEGLGGIEVKAGTVTIADDATITATATEQSHTTSNNGTSTSGYAIAAVNNSNYSDSINVSIGNATITGVTMIFAEANATEYGTVTATSSGLTTEDGYAWSATGSGTYQLYPAVAKIDDVYYAFLADAIAAVPTDGTATTITMVTNVTIDVVGNAVTNPANKSVILDLNGMQIIGVNSTGASSALLYNRGTLVIKDSSDTDADGTGTGALAYSAAPSWTWDGTSSPGGYASNLINNNGTLTIESGYLHNDTNKGTTTAASVASVIDNANPGVITINGGKLESQNSNAIRLYAGSTSDNVSITVNGGMITGARAIWLQQNGDNTQAPHMSLTVNGGTLEAVGTSTINMTQPEAVLSQSFGGSRENVSISVSSGTIEGWMLVGSGSSWNPTTSESVTITGGTIGMFVSFRSGSDISGKIAISGGVFGSPVVDAYCADGYIPAVYDEESGLYTVVEGWTITFVGEVEGVATTETTNVVKDAELTEIAAYYATEFAKEYYTISWNPTLAAVTEAATYTATYTRDTVTLTVPTVEHATATLTVTDSGETVTPTSEAGEDGTAYTIDAGCDVAVAWAVTDNTWKITEGASWSAEAIVENATVTAPTVEANTFTVDIGTIPTGAVATITTNGVAVVLDGSTFTALYGTVVSIAWARDGYYIVSGGTESLTVTENVTFTTDNYPTVTEAVAAIGDTYYATLAEAVAAADAESAVLLLRDIDFTAPLEISKDVTINLNGHSITATDSRALWIKSGTVAISGTGTISSVKTSGSSFSDSSSVIRVGDSATNTSAAALTIGASVEVTTAHCYGITAFGKNTAGISLTVNGTVAVTGTASAISGNGTSAATSITIADSADVSATTDAGVYFPGEGTLTISGGTITGPTAVYVKSGTVAVSGGEMIATGAATTYAYNSNGLVATGDAFVIDSCGYPGGAPAVTISGGKFKSAYASPVASYASNDETVVTRVITSTSAALFSNNSIASTLFAIGYQAGTNTDTTTSDDYPYTVAAAAGYYVYDADNNTVAKVDFSSEDLAAMEITATEADAIEAALNTVDETTALLVWQKYVLSQTTKITATNIVTAAEEDETHGVETTLSDAELKAGFTKTTAVVMADGTAIDGIEGLVLPAFSTVESNALYKVAVTLTPTDGDAVTILSDNTIGVMALDVPKTAIIGVPWESLETDGSVTVADLVRTDGLTDGDKLYAYVDGSYSAWEVADGAWSPVTIATEDMTTVSKAASEVTLSRGNALWLTRASNEDPVYLVGEYSTNTVTTTVEAGTTSSPSWTMVSSASLEGCSLSGLLTGTTNQVMIPTEGAPKNYIVKNGVPGRYVTVTTAHGVFTKWVAVTDEDVIPAGVGFWYLNNDTSEKEITLSAATSSEEDND